ncbi:MAG: isoprenylcysteine carboxylmethyltransferase family protein, partial [Halanaeroarchaeum sp.]
MVGRMIVRLPTAGPRSFSRPTPVYDTELHTDGPHAHSRIPQYVGMLNGLLGLPLVASAARGVSLLALHVVWVLLLPYAEKPWRRAQFGEEDEQYRARPPVRRTGDRSSGHRVVGMEPCAAPAMVGSHTLAFA